MSQDSLTKQTLLLMLGRILPMPLAFCVPIVLARLMSMHEFGVYKQVFMVFAVFIPLVDLGITNSLYYFIPRMREEKDRILLHTILLQGIAGAFLLLVITVWRDLFSEGITGTNSLGVLLPFVVFLAFLWNGSGIIEALLIVEKKSTATAVVVFVSEILRSLIIVGVVAMGGGVAGILYGLISLAFVRGIILFLYSCRQYHLSFSLFERKMLWVQICYAFPFGIAVIISGFTATIHQFVVSRSLSAEEFAIFSVGCFQLPFLAVLVDSVARTSLVRIAELRNNPDAKREIAQLVSRCCRKLWLVLFPVFVFLLIISDSFIVLLFSENYRESVVVFQVFIFVIPVSALLVQQVLRAYQQTTFIMWNNFFCLVITALFCYVGLLLDSLRGVALGFVLGQIVWKSVFIRKICSILQCHSGDILPYGLFVKTAVFTFLAAVPATLWYLWINSFWGRLGGGCLLFWPLLFLLLWRYVLDEEEQQLCSIGYNKCMARLLRFSLR